jgi:hypothetical protein
LLGIATEQFLVRMHTLKNSISVIVATVVMSGCVSPSRPDIRLDGSAPLPREQAIRLHTNVQKTVKDRPFNIDFEATITHVNGKPTGGQVVQLEPGSYELTYTCRKKFDLNDAQGSRVENLKKSYKFESSDKGKNYYPWVAGRLTDVKYQGAQTAFGGIGKAVEWHGTCWMSELNTNNPFFDM